MAFVPPARPHLTGHRDLGWVLFPAGLFGVVALAGWLGWLVFGEDPAVEAAGLQTDWTVPLLGMSSLVVTAVLVWVGLVTWERGRERWAVRKVYERGLVRWPQYATEAQWQQVIEKEDEPEGSWHDLAWPVGIVGTIVVILAVFFGVGGEWPVAFALVGFGLVSVVALVAWYVNRARDRRARRVRRKQLLPYPSVVLAADGFYHEDTGLTRLHQVTGVRVISPGEVPEVRKQLRRQVNMAEIHADLDPLDGQLARAGWPLLEFTLDSRVSRTFWTKLAGTVTSHEYVGPMPVTVRHVRVPPGREGEAATVARTVTHRWLGADWR